MLRSWCNLHVRLLCQLGREVGVANVGVTQGVDEALAERKYGSGMRIAVRPFKLFGNYRQELPRAEGDALGRNSDLAGANANG
jgi:hypothetical protein